MRGDGVPYAERAQNPGGDPGVAVYWTVEQERQGRWQLVPYCMPCDRWDRVADNLHAIALSIEAMRGIERWGAVSLEQAFAGFTALPPGSGGPDVGEPVKQDRHWREVFDLVGEPWTSIPPRDLLPIVKARYRDRLKENHPDRGGSVAVTQELNTAFAKAEKDLSS